MTWLRMPLGSWSECSPSDGSSDLQVQPVPWAIVNSNSKKSNADASTQQNLARTSLRGKKPAFVDKPRELFGNLAVNQWCEKHNLSQQGCSTSMWHDECDMTHLTQLTIWHCCNIRNRTGMTPPACKQSHLLAFPQCKQKSVVGVGDYLPLLQLHMFLELNSSMQQAKCPWQWLTAPLLRQMIQSHWMPNRRSRRRHPPTTPVS